MTTERIDVLAVMDGLLAFASRGVESDDPARPMIEAGREARAAVAELIEAADGVDATHGPMLNGAVDQKVQQLAIDRLRAALARVGAP